MDFAFAQSANEKLVHQDSKHRFTMRSTLVVILAASLGLLVGSQLQDTLAIFSERPAIAAPVPQAATRATTRKWALIEHRPEGPAVPCPSQAAVVFTAGQSNAANSVGHRSVARHEVYSMYASRCYRAVGAMPGAEGRLGSIWPSVGDQMIEAGIAKAVIFVNAAMGGTGIAQWDEGDLGEYLAVRLAAVPTIDYVLWHQGEYDIAMPAQEYARHLSAVIRTIRSATRARILIAQASRCGPGASESEILIAQRSVVDPSRGIYAGPNTDGIDEMGDRYDDCHFSEQGARKASRLWVKSLLAAH